RHVPITEHLPDLPPGFVRVIDKLLAHKPHERYPSAADAATALESLIRPRSRPLSAVAPSVARSPQPPAPAVPSTKAPVEAKQQALPDGPMVVKVRSTYPPWFEPAARLVERRPQTALIGFLVGVTLVFAAGIVAGVLIKILLG